MELSTLGDVIKAAYEDQPNTNEFSDAEKIKLAEIQGLSAEDRVKIDSTQVFTQIEKSKLAGLSIDPLAPIATSGAFSDLVDVPALIPMTDKAKAYGVATLDASGTVPMEQLNVSGLSMKGAWNASTNTPSLLDGVGTVGDFYKTSVAGTFNFGNGDYTFVVGDWVIYAGGTWQRIGVHESVTMVNGQTGMVQLTAEDVGAMRDDYIPAWGEVSGKPNFNTLYKPLGYVPAWGEVSGKPNFDTLYQKKQRGTIGPAIVAGLFRKSSNQAFAQSTAATVSWQVSTYDQFNIRSGDTFVVPSWAKYARVTGDVQWGGNSGSNNGILAVQVMLNGVTGPGLGASRTFGNINVIPQQFHTGIFPVKTGDVLTIQASQATAANRNIEAGSSGQASWVQVELYE